MNGKFLIGFAFLIFMFILISSVYACTYDSECPWKCSSVKLCPGKCLNGICTADSFSSSCRCSRDCNAECELESDCSECVGKMYYDINNRFCSLDCQCFYMGGKCVIGKCGAECSTNSDCQLKYGSQCYTCEECGCKAITGALGSDCCYNGIFIRNGNTDTSGSMLCVNGSTYSCNGVQYKTGNIVCDGAYDWYCNRDSSGGKPLGWLKASSFYTGKIFFSPNYNYDALSIGNSWGFCDSQYNNDGVPNGIRMYYGQIVQALQHDYICVRADPYESIAECCGSNGVCYSSSDGIRISHGSTREGYYCNNGKLECRTVCTESSVREDVKSISDSWCVKNEHKGCKPREIIEVKFPSSPPWYWEPQTEYFRGESILWGVKTVYIDNINLYNSIKANVTVDDNCQVWIKKAGSTSFVEVPELKINLGDSSLVELKNYLATGDNVVMFKAVDIAGDDSWGGTGGRHFDMDWKITMACGIEICDNQDNDCDNLVDEVCDADCDNYLNATVTCSGSFKPCNGTKTAVSCTTYGGTSRDCNDSNALINPGAQEICGNGIDENCNNQIDEGCCVPNCAGKECGDDGCGGSCGTCHTYGFCATKGTPKGTIYTGYCRNGICEKATAPDEICDLIDNDCDNLVDEVCDADCDNYVDNRTIQCKNYFKPCNGTKGDSFLCSKYAGDCNDSNALINPVMSEVCDLIDNDCDGLIDENITCIGLPICEEFPIRGITYDPRFMSCSSIVNAMTRDPAYRCCNGTLTPIGGFDVYWSSQNSNSYKLTEAAEGDYVSCVAIGVTGSVKFEIKKPSKSEGGTSSANNGMAFWPVLADEIGTYSCNATSGTNSKVATLKVTESGNDPTKLPFFGIIQFVIALSLVIVYQICKERKLKFEILNHKLS